MPSLLDIRRRIRAVKSTQQITKAMKMVAASKLRRAQERIQQARPFAMQMQRVLNSLAARVDPAAHPLLDERKAPRAGGRALLFVITADRGLCGSFNANVIKAAANFITEQPGPPGRARPGRPPRPRLLRQARLRGPLRADQPVREAALRRRAGHRADARWRRSSAARWTACYLVYNEFKSVMQQRVVVEQLLPIPRAAIEARPRHRRPGRPPVDYLYEPAPEELFKTLLPRHVEVQVYRALLESNAAFYAAQMTAMDAATRNSGEMIESLTLYMNKVRQAAITSEIIEVVSGAGAL